MDAGIKDEGVAEAESESPDWTCGADIAFSTAYVFWGVLWVDDPVVQPSFWAGIEGFSLGIWANQDLTNVNNRAGDVTEIDYWAEYAGTVAVVDYGIGVLTYLYPDAGVPGTTELYLRVGVNMLPVTPTLKVNYDVDQAHGLYFALDLDWGMDLTSLSGTPFGDIGVELGVNVHLGLADKKFSTFYYGQDSFSLADLQISVSFPLTVASGSVTLSFKYATILDGDIRDLASDPDNFWFVVSIAF